jgi:translation initiation factor IF-3
LKRPEVPRAAGLDLVKITLRFRSREMAHQELGTKLLNCVKDDVEPIGKVGQEPKFEGRQMIMVLAPKKGKKH